MCPVAENVAKEAFKDYLGQVHDLIKIRETKVGAEKHPIESENDYISAAHKLKDDVKFIKNLINKHAGRDIAELARDEDVCKCLTQIQISQFEIAIHRDVPNLSKAKVAASRAAAILFTNSIVISGLGGEEDNEFLYRGLQDYIHDHTVCMDPNKNHDSKLISRNPDIFGDHRPACKKVYHASYEKRIEKKRHVSFPAQELIWAIQNTHKSIKSSKKIDTFCLDAFCSIVENYVSIDAMARYEFDKNLAGK